MNFDSASGCLRRIFPCRDTKYGNCSSSHKIGSDANYAFENSKREINKIINVGEIFITSGSTESNNWVIKGLSKYGAIIICPTEHPSIVIPALSFFNTIVCKVDNNGQVDLNNLEYILSQGKYRLFCVSLVAHITGVKQDLNKIIPLCHKYKCLVHVDATQAIGKIPFQKFEFDYMCFSAHKFHGPVGIGILAIGNGRPIPDSLIVGGSQQNGHRAGTINLDGILETLLTLKYIYDNEEKILLHKIEMSKLFINLLKEKNISFIQHGYPTVPGFFCLSFIGKKGEDLVRYLSKEGICISTGSACTSRDNNKKHQTLISMGVSQYLINYSVRISFSFDIKKEDIIFLLNKILLF